MKTFNITFPFQVKFHPSPISPRVFISSVEPYACANTIATILFRHPLNWVIRSHKASGAWNARNKRSLHVSRTQIALWILQREREKRSIRYGESISPRPVERDSSPSPILRERKTRIRVPGDGFSDPLRAKYRGWKCALWRRRVMREARRWRDLAEVLLGFFPQRGGGTKRWDEGIWERSIYLLTWISFAYDRFGDRFEDFACGTVSIWISLVSKMEIEDEDVLNCEIDIG